MPLVKRKDQKGRLLREGESQRKDGRYMFRYTDVIGEVQSIYSSRLVKTDPVQPGKKNELSLREKEELIQKDILDGINTIGGLITLDMLFYKYLKTKRKVGENTINGYKALFNEHVKNSPLGNAKIKDIKKSDILRLYNCLSKKGLSNGTIRNLNNNVLSPTFQLAVDDDDLRKNPCKGCLKEYPYNPLGKRESLTIEEQENFIEFIRNDNVYSKYLPIILLILGTALRRGEVLGLTWKDIDLKNKTIKIDHQLYYHKVDGVYRFGICRPKSESGNRTIPLTKEMIALLQEIKRKEYFNGINAKVTVDGITDFVFLNNQKNNVLIPRQFGDSLTAACNKYNNREEKLAERENRDPILLPIVTPHVLRHTACTRMAESGMDIKVLQAIMGHSKADMTMNIYNHVDLHRISKEMEKMEGSKAALMLG